MKLDEAAELLRLHRTDWERADPDDPHDDGPIADVLVFGSVARNAANPESDVDLMVRFSRPSGLLRLARAKLDFEEILRRRVDVITAEGLMEPLRAEILADAISIDDGPERHEGPRRKRWRWRLEEMLSRLDRIERYTTGLTEPAFRENELARDAVLHNLMYVGESVQYLPEGIRLLHPHVPWEELRQVRHLIAHDYFGIDVSLLWHTIRHELPEVRRGLLRVLPDVQR